MSNSNKRALVAVGICATFTFIINICVSLTLPDALGIFGTPFVSGAVGVALAVYSLVEKPRF